MCCTSGPPISRRWIARWRLGARRSDGITVAPRVRDDHRFGLDAHAYYLTGQRGDLYGWPDGSSYGYLYSPLFAQIIKPLTALPWPAFQALWIGAEAIAFGWLLWPLPIRWRALAYLYVVPALCLGNIFGALGVALVLSMRQRPGLWAHPLLTKVVPAGVGLVWYAVRGEWRNVSRSCGTSR